MTFVGGVIFVNQMVDNANSKEGVMKHGISLNAAVATEKEAKEITRSIVEVLKASYEHRSDEVTVKALDVIMSSLTGAISNTNISSNAIYGNDRRE